MNQDPQPSDRHLQDKLDEVVHQIVVFLLPALAFLYAIFAVAHAAILPSETVRVLSPLAALTSLVFLISWFALRGGRPIVRRTHVYATGIAMLALLNSLTHLYLSGEPRQSTNVMLVAIGLGCMMLSSRWFGANLALVVVSWGWIAGAMPADAAWSHYSFALLTSVVISIVLHVVRVQVYKRLFLEQARTQAALEELARSNTDLDQFAYIASHDLQEPLRKVQTFAERLQTLYGDRLDDRGQDYLRRMVSASVRMQQLIRSLLDFSRVTSQQQPFAPVDLSKIVREVLADLEVRIEQTSATVHLDALPSVVGDPTQMRQLMQNLIGNALKFHRKGVAPVVRVFEQPEKGNQNESRSTSNLCRVVVQDNGVGFDPAHSDQIFQLFQRLHGRSDYEGTGVGLSTCKKIVQRHGGSIGAESCPGQGSTFFVNLPLAAGQNEQKRAAGKSAACH